MASPESDENLMRQTAAGSTAALEQLVRRHAAALFAFLFRMCGDRHRAEELFQESFLLVWRKRARYEYPRLFRPWLFALAVNLGRAFWRQHHSHEMGEVNGVVDPDIPPDGKAEAGETADLVAQAVLALPTRQREVVTLRIWEGLPYARIAEIIDVPEATARSHMRLALAALRERLGPVLGEVSTKTAHY
jgi:RNA polymerase sigma-70 factor (ECF subfamily)